jgi:hypothetical protein
MLLFMWSNILLILKLWVIILAVHKLLFRIISSFFTTTKVSSMSDANWGPQDASITMPMFNLPLFASCSMSAFLCGFVWPSTLDV